MVKPIGVVALVIIVFVIGFLIYDGEAKKQTQELSGEFIGVGQSKLKEIQEKITCYSNTNDFTCGTVEYTTNSNAIKEETETIQVIQEVTLANGTIVNETSTQVIPKVSTADITYLDKQTGDFMVCKQGHQCIIEARVQLYNLNEELVSPPYGYSLTISCEFREWCDHSTTISTNAGTVTDGGGGIRYSWTTKPEYSLGDYEVILNIRSAVLDLNGNPVNLEKRIPLVLIS